MGAELELDPELQPEIHIPDVVVIPYGHTFASWPATDVGMTALIREVLDRPSL